MEDININEIKRLQELERKQKERYKKQNEHTKTLYDRISFTVPKGKKSDIEKLAASKKMSLNAYISSLVLYELEKQEQKQRAEEFAKRNNSNNEEVYNDLPFDIN